MAFDVRWNSFHGSLVLDFMSENLDDTTPTSKEGWRDYFLARPEHLMQANQALSVGVGALILALVAILQQCRG
jgi:hypothetical protein